MTPLSLRADQTSGRSPVSPGFTQPLRFTPEGGAGKLRPVSIELLRSFLFVLTAPVMLHVARAWVYLLK